MTNIEKWRHEIHDRFIYIDISKLAGDRDAYDVWASDGMGSIEICVGTPLGMAGAEAQRISDALDRQLFYVGPAERDMARRYAEAYADHIARAIGCPLNIRWLQDDMDRGPCYSLEECYAQWRECLDDAACESQ